MLIVIEGIDGSGKSTVAPLVRRALAPQAVGPVAAGKHAIGPADPDTTQRAEQLRQLIWASAESAGDTFGAAHWILLIASWYAGLSRLRPDLTTDGELAVMDGWYYRNIAKTLIREPLDPAWVESLFEPAPQPDLVVLLDVPPETAWQRRTDFKDTELGRWDGFDGPPFESFCAYQGLIRQELLRMAEDRGWLVLDPGPDATPERTANVIAEFARRTPVGRTDHPEEDLCSPTWPTR
ncbi:dTMP kinase [Kitasatospora sp. HPMI-4]|uniref:dTMP kinase n=1 Tax=Kitasatospora sp. HPMI-4 TaxID=3448443 RepID=UPI003F1C5AFE